MNFNIFEPKRKIFGVHLGAATLKVFQIDSDGQNSKIIGYGSVPIAKTVMLNGEILNKETLVSLIEHTVEKPGYGSISTKYAILSVSESKSFLRVIHIPEMNEAEAENAILFEAEAYIPLPMDQVYFDWQILRKDGGRMEVLIMAVPKDHVDQLLEVFEEAEVHIVGIEIESQSLARAVIPSINPANTLIVDIDASKTTLITVGRGTVRFTSVAAIGGNMLTQSIADALGLTLDKAEKVKQSTGIANVPDYPNLRTQLKPTLDNLASEIKNILRFHYEHSPDHLDEIILTGSNAKLKHLDEYLADALSEFAPLKVSVANPFLNLPKIIESPLTSYEALSYTTPLGLSMRPASDKKIKLPNLLPKLKQQEIKDEYLFLSIFRAGIIALATIGLVILAQLGTSFYMGRMHAKAEKNIEQIKKQISKDENTELKNQIKEVNNQLKDFKDLADSAPTWSRVVRAFSRHVPEGVKILSFSTDITKKKVDIIGYSPSRDLVIKLHENIAADQENFFDIDYPLENIAKPTDVNFHFTFFIKDSLLFESHESKN